MKIGLISDSLNGLLTGVSYYTYNLVNNFDQGTKNNLYLINHHNNATFPHIKSIVIKNPFPFMKTYAWYPYIIRKINEHDLDIVHNPSQVPTYFPLKAKYVITVNDLTPFITPQESKTGRSSVFRMLFPKTLRSADKIICISHNTKDDLIKKFNISSEKISVIHLAVNDNFRKMDSLNAQKILHNYGIRTPYILYVGTLEARKNIPSLIKAFNKLKDLRIPHQLVIGGKMGWKYKEIFDLTNQLNLTNKITFTGYVKEEDLPILYNAADLFVYPSLYEGFGLPPLEAMACGCPVITSNTSSLPEVVGDAGIMINPTDVNKLADSIYEVLMDKGLQADLTRKGLDRAKLFSWKKCAEETQKIYRML